MPRMSEFSSYVFIKNDLKALKWNTNNPNRDPNGQVYTQQECLDHPELGPYLLRQRPEYVVKVRENVFWIIEAKGNHNQIDIAFNEALDYARAVLPNTTVKPFIISGVAGNDSDGYIIKTAVVLENGSFQVVTYNDRVITGLLSPDQARYLADNTTHRLNDLVTDEELFLSIAEKVNEILHSASINKDLRATVIAATLLSMVSDTLPNFNASPDVFVRDINNRAEDVLITHSKREFAEQIELRLPHEEAAKAKYKEAVVKVFFMLSKINIKAAMNGNQDVLGKFYEVFLKYGNGAKDIGIVLTPRHVTLFASEILDVNAADLVYDPACGTGGFLVAAYDRVRRNEPNAVEMFKKHRIFGIEQQANVAALAIVNMIFRGDGKNNIINENCFAKNINRKIRNGEVSGEYISEQNDRPPVTKVLMNPPFALKKDDEQEYTFVNHALKQMQNDGLLLCVLPLSVMYSGGNDEAWRRLLLLNNTLLAVISFSNELFYPQASVEPVIIVIRKGVPHAEQQNIFWLRVLNDGYRKIKRKRLPIPGVNDMSLYLERIKSFIHDGTLPVHVPGICEAKAKRVDDTHLELIPQNYLDNPQCDKDKIQKEIKRIYSSVIFETLGRETEREYI